MEHLQCECERYFKSEVLSRESKVILYLRLYIIKPTHF